MEPYKNKIRTRDRIGECCAFWIKTKVLNIPCVFGQDFETVRSYQSGHDSHTLHPGIFVSISAVLLGQKNINS